MWDGRAGTPEEQVLGSIKSPGEMNQSLDGVTRILSEIDRYQPAFSVAFPDQTITAIAPFDAWG